MPVTRKRFFFAISFQENISSPLTQVTMIHNKHVQSTAFASPVQLGAAWHLHQEHQAKRNLVATRCSLLLLFVFIADA